MKTEQIVLRTGYFAKAKEYADAGFALVSIALKQPWFLPKDLRLFQLMHLAPSEELLALKDRPDLYAPKYMAEVLEENSAEAMLSRFQHIAEEAKTNKVVLLCWEAPGKFCHRHLVASWLKSRAGVDVREFSKEDSAYAVRQETSLKKKGTKSNDNQCIWF